MLKHIRPARRQFYRYARAYMIVLLISFLIGMVTYMSAYTRQRNSTIESYRMLLEQSSLIVDSHFQEIDNTAAQLSQYESLTEILTDCVQSPVVPTYKLLKLCDSIPSFRLFNGFIQDTVIYCPEKNFIASSVCATPNIELFYKTYLNYGNMNYSQWQNKLMETVYRSTWASDTITRQGVSKDYITCVYQLRYKKTPAYLIILIDSRDIYSIYSTLTSGEDVSLSMEDASGVELLSTLSDQNVSPHKWLAVTNSNVGTKGYNYTLFLSHEMLTRQLRVYVEIYCLGLLFLLIIGIVVAMLISQKRFDRLSRILNSSEQAGYTDVFSFMSDTFTNIREANTRMAARIDAQQQLLQITLLKRLLTGIDMDESQTREAFRQCAITLPEQGGFVMTVRIVAQDSLDLPTQHDVLELSYALSLEFIECFRIITLKSNDVALIFGTESVLYQETCAEICVRALEFSQRIRKNDGLCVVFGIGGHKKSWSDMYTSAMEANVAANMFRGDAQNVFTYEMVKQTDDTPFLTPNMVLLLKDSVEKRKVEQIHKLTEEVFAGKSMPPDIARMIYYCTLNLAMQILFEHSMKSTDIDALREKRSIASISDYQKTVEKVLTEISYQIHDSKTEEGALLDHIMNYLNAHYMDPELDLVKMGDQVGMTGKAFSRFFKDQSGHNFSAVLESLRMKAAADMLLSGGMSVKDIAMQVGYTNVNTFYKAFKRVYEISPSEMTKE